MHKFTKREKYAIMAHNCLGASVRPGKEKAIRKESREAMERDKGNALEPFPSFPSTQNL
jgi:hypothetical protein